MQPPICDICNKRFTPDENADLLYFKKTTKGVEFEEQARQGLKGHHPDSAWFCSEHYAKAMALKELPIDEARKILKTTL